MKKVIFACLAVVLFGSCSKKQEYICSGTFNGSEQIWRPAGQLTKKELKASIKHYEDMGVTNIICVPNH